MDINSIERYFANEALTDAMLTTENQIFLSASEQDSERTQQHVVGLASSLGLSLSGNPLILPNGAMLSFLLVGSRVSAGYSGNAYVINCFDDTNFSYVSNLVSSWTMLKKHRSVFLSVN